MRVLSFIHQKGGTGKSTLAIACSIWLAGSGQRVMLLDTDYQGTSSEWGNRFGREFDVETRSQVQPIVHKELPRFENAVDWLIVDGPPALSEMTESVARCGGRLILPVRPSLPDIWALPWMAAVIGKLARTETIATPHVVFNQVRGESLGPLIEQIEPYGIPVLPRPIPADPAFARLFEGEPLPERFKPLIEQLVGLAAEPD